MTALTNNRNTPQLAEGRSHGLAAAAVKIFAGALVMRDTAGNLTKGQTAVGLVGVGRCEQLVDNSSGAAGAETVRYQMGIFAFENSSAADEITAANIGDVVYAVDDQTVALTDGGATRSPAGVVHQVEDAQIWVRLDEALTNAS